MYDWWYFDRYSRQINAFTMVTMEIYLYTCRNIVTNVTVDFPTFAGNTRKLQRRLNRNAGGNYTQMGALARRERLSLLKAVPGIKPRTG